jgi:hypothetical protein
MNAPFDRVERLLASFIPPTSITRSMICWEVFVDLRAGLVSGLDIIVNALSALAVAGAQIEVHGGGVDAIAVGAVGAGSNPPATPALSRTLLRTC